MWNPWKHLRLAGSVVMIAGAFTNTILLTFIGFFIQYVGVVGGLDLVERRLEALEPKEEDDAVR